jgi:hypothetical protein
LRGHYAGHLGIPFERLAAEYNFTIAIILRLTLKELFEMAKLVDISKNWQTHFNIRGNIYSIMAVFELNINEPLDEEFFPVAGVEMALRLSLEFETHVPEMAQRRFALEALKRLVDDLESFDFDVMDDDEAAIRDAEMETSDWAKPGNLDMRVIKSAHRVVQEIAMRGESGRAVTASELVQSGIVSAPTMARLMKPDEESGEYMAPFLLINPAGRTRALDLTPKGRVLASKIRAGVIPA